MTTEKLWQTAVHVAAARDTAEPDQGDIVRVAEFLQDATSYRAGGRDTAELASVLMRFAAWLRSNALYIADLEKMVEHLYDLDRAELRRLAFEALLISDGPDGIEGDVENSPIQVDRTQADLDGDVVNTFCVHSMEGQ